VFVYFLRPIGQDGPVKIGSSVAPEVRLATYMHWSPMPLEIAATLQVAKRSVEGRFHSAFRHLHTHHEWFRADPALTAAIDAIRAGTFDISGLPPTMQLYQLSATDPWSAPPIHSARLCRASTSATRIRSRLISFSDPAQTGGDECVRRKARAVRRRGLGLAWAESGPLSLNAGLMNAVSAASTKTRHSGGLAEPWPRSASASSWPSKLSRRPSPSCAGPWVRPTVGRGLSLNRLEAAGVVRRAVRQSNTDLWSLAGNE
jgi:hypothetical protein